LLDLFHSNGCEVLMLPVIKPEKVKNYFQQKQIKMVQSSGNCPDLNQIEN